MPVSNIFARASQTNSTLGGAGHGYRKIEGNQLVQHYVTPVAGGGGRGVLPYISYTGMCHWTGYVFWPLCPKQSM